ncbi:MAG: hypothetical protein WCK11_01900 [Candidatus Falkowbacteria bacterium]
MNLLLTITYLKNSLNKIIFILGIFFVAIIIFYHMSYLGDPDNGVLTEGAWRLYHGDKLYLDFFEYIPPGNFYIIYWAWLILGPHYWIAKSIGIVGILLGALGLYFSGKIVSNSRLVLMPPALFLIASAGWPIINHNSFSTTIIIWFTFFIIKFLNQKKQILMLSVAGFLLGLSGLFLLHRSIIVFIATIIFLLWQYTKNSLKYILFFTLSFILPLTILIIFWPIDTIFKSLIVFPLFNYEAINQYPKIFFYPLVLSSLLIFYYSRNVRNNIYYFLIFIQAGLFWTTLSRPDYSHLTIAVFPTLLWCSYALAQNIRQNIQWVSMFIISMFIYFPALGWIVGIFDNYVFFTKPLYMHDNSLTRYFNKNCSSSPYIYAGPFSPSLYPDLRKLNPTSFPFLLTNHNTKSQFELAAKQLYKNKPGCILMNYDLVKKFSYTINNPVDNFINNNYQAGKKFGSTQFFLPKTCLQ